MELTTKRGGDGVQRGGGLTDYQCLRVVCQQSRHGVLVYLCTGALLVFFFFTLFFSL